MVKRPRCAYCGRAFTPARRGRPPKYCSASHRQMAYVLRRFDLPFFRRRRVRLELGQAIEDVRTKDGIERAVIAVLCNLGFSLPEPRNLRACA